MIIREIVENPRLIWKFDWFNDFSDTRRYLIGSGRIDLVAMLDDGYIKWLGERLNNTESSVDQISLTRIHLLKKLFIYVMDREDIDEWFDTENDALEGFTPYDLIRGERDYLLYKEYSRLSKKVFQNEKD